MKNYDSLSEAIEGLKKEGYVEDFNLKQDCIECRNGQFQIFHNEFQIDSVHRFDVDTDPADQAILYAISSEKYHLKGVLVNGYGIYTNEISDEMLSKLEMKQNIP